MLPETPRNFTKSLFYHFFNISNGRYPRFAFKDLTDSKRAQIFEMWIKALGGGAVTKRAADEQRLRQLAGFDPLGEDELDEVQDALEVERSDKSTESFYKSETQKRVYEHAKSKDFVLKLAQTRKY